MASLIAREEPLLKQLVRSRACKRKDPLSTGFGPPIRNARSFSQPPPRMKAPLSQPATPTSPGCLSPGCVSPRAVSPGYMSPGCISPGSPGAPGVQYTLQWLPYSMVFNPMSHLPVGTISLSQPDLSKCGVNPVSDFCWSGIRSLCSSPQGSRCSSVSPMRCPSPIPATLSPCIGSCHTTRPATPTGARACSPGPSRPTTPTIMINSQELFYAGVADNQDIFRGSPIPRKLNHLTSNNSSLSPSGEESPKMNINEIQWKVALEAERLKSRKYSLTENIIHSFDRGRSSDRDANNNAGQQIFYNNAMVFDPPSPNINNNNNWLASPCCCFNDLCCKVCLVLEKDTSNLTLEELQTRALNNLLRQRKQGGKPEPCHCANCSKVPNLNRQNVMRVETTQLNKKKEIKSQDLVKKKAATLGSASGSNQGAIDNRIEQAMDLVKSHLMNAVRSEVEELKEKIIKLEEIISQLQSENEFLRANVHRDVLLQLQQQQQLQIQQQQSLGSPPTQPALPQTPQLN